MSSSINVEPKNNITTIVNIEIMNVSVDLYKSATFSVILKAQDGSIIGSQNVFMPTESYTLWNNDDIFAENFVLQQLGLVRSSTGFFGWKII